MKIPTNDLKRSTGELRHDIDSAVSRVLASGWYVLGPENEAFEQELADYLQINNVITVGNGTDALGLALAAVGVGLGSIVVSVANAGAYTTTAALQLGAEMAYCDVDEKTLLMSVSTLENVLAVLPSKPAAIVVTHLYGAMAPVREIFNFAQSRGIPLIEDCAQSLGATIEGKSGGSFSNIATTSFYPTKNLGALGDGGAVFTNNAELGESVRRMRQYGWGKKYSIEFEHGRNSRLDELQAAILRLKLPYLDDQNNRRREIHSGYEAVSSANNKLLNSASESFNGHLAVMLSSERERTRNFFDSRGISTDIHYPIPDHMQRFPHFAPLKTPLDVTEWASQSVLSLPLFPEMNEHEVSRVIEAISCA